MSLVNIFVIILLNFIAVFFWLWILSKISYKTDLDKIKIIFYLAISSTILLLGYDLLNEQGYLGGVSDIRYIYFRGFIIIGLSLSYLLINKKINLLYISKLILSGGLGFLSFVLGGKLWQAARSEEITKFFSANSIYDRNKKVSSDILIYSALAAVGFGFIENIIYLIRGIISERDVLTIGVSRFLMIYIMHIFFTGIVGYGSYVDEKNANSFYIASMITMVIGATIHGLYNYFLSSTDLIIVFLLMFLGYFFIIYIFYKSDRLFAGSAA